MNALIRFLRTAGLAAAVLVLPCCRDQVGKGDEEAQITVRASLNLAKIEPNQGCFEPAISSNGRWLVFASYSNVITPNDNNGRRDIFLKDRETGEIFNLTDPFVFPFTAQLAPADCFDPTVSDDGNFIAFRSKGAWDPYFIPASAMPFDGIFRLDRTDPAAIVYERAFDAGGPPDAGMFQPTISADGQKVAFKSAATDMTPANVGGLTQIYVYDFNTLTMRIASKQEGAVTNTPCNGNCDNPRISANGDFVVFESQSTNLDAGTAALPKPQAYRGTAAGADVLPVATDFNDVLTDEVSFKTNISADGTTVVFHSTDQQLLSAPLPPGTFDFMLRKNLVTNQTDLVTDQPGNFPIPIFPNGFIPSLSADGRMVAFNSRDSALAGGITLNHVQVFVRDMVTGKVFFCSRHKDGTPSNLDVDAPLISGDGRWALWSTVGSTLVDGDTNGVSDIFLRGPLR